MIRHLQGRKALFITLTLGLFILGFSALDQSRAFAASSEESRAALLEGARREGKVSFYTAMNVQDSKAVAEKFQEKYPFIRVDVNRSNNINTMNRILMEARANKRINDVVMTTADMTKIMLENGVLAKYLSPERKFFAEGFKDKDGYWTDHHISVHSVVYNTRLVPPKQAPVTYQDLLDPRWQGKLGINLNNFMWIAVVMDIMGKEKGLAFLKALAQQNPSLRKGGTLTTLLVAAGELSIAVSVNANNVEDVKAKGAPVDWARLKEPLYGEMHPVALNALAPHPNAGKLFIDFVLSREGQEFVVPLGQIPSRIGIESAFIKAEDVRPLVPTSGKETAYYQDLTRKIFVK